VSSDDEDVPVDVPVGHHVVQRVLAYDPAEKRYLVHWLAFPAASRTWEPGAALAHEDDDDEGAVERFRLRAIANVGWVFASADSKRAFHEKHDLIDLGELPVPVPRPTTNASLHRVTQAQRAAYVLWLKRRIGQCEWVAGCTHRVAQEAPAAAGDREGRWPVACFDFHHVRAATKVDSVSKLPVTVFPAESIWAEAAKCILLCKMHHAVVETVSSGSEQGYSPECGGRGRCTFAGHSLYDYVHPDEARRRHPRGEEPWTTPALLEERGRPWQAADVPPARSRATRSRRPRGASCRGGRTSPPPPRWTRRGRW
jgi:hypothetical protein